jgi:DUF1365 family protein
LKHTGTRHQHPRQPYQTNTRSIAYTQLATMAILAAVVASFILIPLATFVLLPLFLALVAKLRTSPRRKFQSVLYVGKVWHTRFLPKIHAFNYPIFMFALDLEEVLELFQRLWPLSWLVSFRETDHLINREGCEDGSSNTFTNRIFRLVAKKTNDKFQPSLETHRVVLMTHLCYYGYNFNPVSFYYLLDRKTDTVSAMVGEVSNTPWCEMYCYVLHPDSVDKVEIPKDDSTKSKHYVFPKNFHVSPFMEMDYLYDWTFTGTPGNSITIINALRRQDKIHFTAKLQVEPQSVDNPLVLAWQLVRYPVFCMIIQIWIHYQAALLFIKGVMYIPHPQGSETAASKTIAAVMAPFFAVRDFITPKPKRA